MDLSVTLYEATKGKVALVCAVLESQSIGDRFRVRLRLSSVCPYLHPARHQPRPEAIGCMRQLAANQSHRFKNCVCTRLASSNSSLG